MIWYVLPKLLHTAYRISACQQSERKFIQSNADPALVRLTLTASCRAIGPLYPCAIGLRNSLSDQLQQYQTTRPTFLFFASPPCDRLAFFKPRCHHFSKAIDRELAIRPVFLGQLTANNLYMEHQARSSSTRRSLQFYEIDRLVRA